MNVIPNYTTEDVSVVGRESTGMMKNKYPRLLYLNEYMIFTGMYDSYLMINSVFFANLS